MFFNGDYSILGIDFDGNTAFTVGASLFVFFLGYFFNLILAQMSIRANRNSIKALYELDLKRLASQLLAQSKQFDLTINSLNNSSIKPFYFGKTDLLGINNFSYLSKHQAFNLYFPNRLYSLRIFNKKIIELPFIPRRLKKIILKSVDRFELPWRLIEAVEYWTFYYKDFLFEQMEAYNKLNLERNQYMQKILVDFREHLISKYGSTNYTDSPETMEIQLSLIQSTFQGYSEKIRFNNEYTISQYIDPCLKICNEFSSNPLSNKLIENFIQVKFLITEQIRLLENAKETFKNGRNNFVRYSKLIILCSKSLNS